MRSNAFSTYQEDGMIWCCGLTKEHLEAFIYWAITCWNARTRAGRGNISYRKYKPLRTDQALVEEDEQAAAEARRGRGSGAGAGAGEEEGEGVEDATWLQARRDAEAARAAGNGETVAVVRKAPKRKKKKAAPAPQRLDASTGRAAREAALRRSQHGASDSSSSSDSDCELEVMLQAAPADVNVETGTWLTASRFWGFGR